MFLLSENIILVLEPNGIPVSTKTKFRHITDRMMNLRHFLNVIIYSDMNLFILIITLFYWNIIVSVYSVIIVQFNRILYSCNAHFYHISLFDVIVYRELNLLFFLSDIVRKFRCSDYL